MSIKLERRIRRDTVGLLRFENKLERLAMNAYRAYAPFAMDAVLPSLVAGISDPLPPDLNALALTQAQWDSILDGTFIPGLERMMAENLAERLDDAGVDLADLAKQAQAAGIGGTVTPVAATSLGTASKVYAAPGIRDFQAQYLSTVRNRMAGTPDSVFKDLSSVLAKGLKDGVGTEGLRKEIQKHLDRTGLSWKGRAETVARTEATGAFNGAALASAQVQQELYGITLEKVWVATIDSRTRKTHFAADGQRRALDAKFKVGKAELDHPGDARGRAEEVIRCRCTMIELEPDEALPGEEDRQTERNDTDATVRNRVGGRVGDIQGEVDRRRDEEGVVRARDDDDGEGFVAAATPKESTMARRTWKATLAPLGKPTGDNRIIKADAKVGFRPFPLFLSWQKTSSDGHMQSVVVGGITDAKVDGDKIVGEGFLLDTDEAVEVEKLLEEKLVRPSIDPADVVWEMVDEDGAAVDWEQMEAAYMAGEEIKVLDAYAELTVSGATLVNFPAFAEAEVILDPVDETDEGVDAEDTDEVIEAEASLVASLAGRATPRGFYFEDPSCFEQPKFDRPTGLHVTADGRIQGHMAIWGTCHIAFGEDAGRCKQPPHSMTNYAHFHVHEVNTPDGPLAVGRLTVAGGHAPDRLGAAAVTQHYDDVATSFAFVKAYEDEFGIAVSGTAIPGVDDQTLSEGLACPLSGDWRRKGGNLEMVASLAVNTPGFPVPRGYRNEEGQEMSLVAAGAIAPRTKKAGESMSDLVQRAASLAAKGAVEMYVQREAVDKKTAATLAKIHNRRLTKANALAARLRSK